MIDKILSKLNYDELMYLERTKRITQSDVILELLKRARSK
jgi:hypothetical protein